MLDTISNSLIALFPSITSYSGNCDKLKYNLSHENGHRHKCNKHKNNDDQVCTNRLMQCIIMILVFVMAFW